MKIASFSIADYCEATEGMPHDVERLFFRMLMKMLSREAGLPDDDRDNARIFGYDIRVYKGLKAKLLNWPDAILLKDGLLVNERVEKDIAEYKSKRKSGVLPAKIGETSGELPPDLSQKSSHIPHATNGKNNNLADPTPSPSPSPTPKAATAALYDRLVTAANGALDNPVNCQGLLNTAVPQMWIDNGADLERDVIPTLEAAGKRYCGKRIRDWGYFTGMVAETKAKRERGMPSPTAAPIRPAKGSEDDRFDRMMRSL